MLNKIFCGCKGGIKERTKKEVLILVYMFKIWFKKLLL